MARRRKAGQVPVMRDRQERGGRARAVFEQCLENGIMASDVTIVTVPSPADRAYATFVARLAADRHS